MNASLPCGNRPGVPVEGGAGSVIHIWIKQLQVLDRELFFCRLASTVPPDICGLQSPYFGKNSSFSKLMDLRAVNVDWPAFVEAPGLDKFRSVRKHWEIG
ncbi:hypothetical protein D3C81_211630 [compost metagenome]